MTFCGAEERGGALERDEVGLFPAFKVPRPTELLEHIGDPRPWMFVGSKGIPVSCFSWDTPNPRATVVLVHGYGSHSMFEWLESRPQLDRVCSEISCKLDLSCDLTLNNSNFRCCTSAESVADPEKLLTGLQTFNVEKVPGRLGSVFESSHQGKCNKERTENGQFDDSMNSVEPYSGKTFSQMSYEGSWVQRFVDSQCRVVAIDLQSHGLSHGWEHKTCQVEAFDEFALDVKTLLQSLANESSLPLFLCGTSMGGCVCIRAAEMLCKSGLLGKPLPGPAIHKQQPAGGEPPLNAEALGGAVVLQSQDCGAGAKECESNELIAGGADSVAVSDIQAVAKAIGAEHRVVRQKPVPLAGLILLAPMLDSSPETDAKSSRIQLSLLSFLRNIIPHCGTFLRTQNPCFPEVEETWKEDSGCFKGRTRLNLLVEMQAGVEAAQANAHWLRREILRDATVPFSLKDWNMLHQRLQHERKMATDGSGDSASKGGSEFQGKPEEVQREGEEKGSRLAVLLVHSLKDTVVRPLGSMRFFEKLGGTVVVPEPWASQLRGRPKEAAQGSAEEATLQQTEEPKDAVTVAASPAGANALDTVCGEESSSTETAGGDCVETKKAQAEHPLEDARVGREEVVEEEQAKTPVATPCKESTKVDQDGAKGDAQRPPRLEHARWLCCGGEVGDAAKKKEEVYLKRRRWRKVAGVVVDEQGRPVDVEEVALMIKQVQESGFEPFPEDVLQSGDLKEMPELDLDENAEYASVCSDGALQLWLLTSQWHMLTKEPGNQELQRNIIDRFLNPTLQRIRCNGEGAECQ